MAMGAIFATAAFLVQAVQHYVGSAGLYPLALVSGLFDVDAISISLAAGAVGGSVDAHVAAAGILLAALANTAVKPAIAGSVGGRGLVLALLPSLGAALAAGAAGWLAAEAGLAAWMLAVLAR
jgi:uncharacterized membrane protein (DUF4010 family)